MNQTTSELLTKPEAAEFLNVSVRTLEREVAAKRLVPVRIRGCVRFRLSDLEAYVEGDA
ncbi:MAG: helix-turn-helix domain-containing protein [Phycisphaera sp.]|nr:helix-turn-helix domain-containing protein [Phycisphaera sp.]